MQFNKIGFFVVLMLGVSQVFAASEPRSAFGVARKIDAMSPEKVRAEFAKIRQAQTLYKQRIDAMAGKFGPAKELIKGAFGAIPSEYKYMVDSDFAARTDLDLLTVPACKKVADYELVSRFENTEPFFEPLVRSIVDDRARELGLNPSKIDVRVGAIVTLDYMSGPAYATFKDGKFIVGASSCFGWVSEEALRAVIHHEVAHIYNGDLFRGILFARISKYSSMQVDRCFERRADLAAMVMPDHSVDVSLLLGQAKQFAVSGVVPMIMHYMKEILKARGVKEFSFPWKDYEHPSFDERIAYSEELYNASNNGKYISPDALEKLIISCDDCRKSGGDFVIVAQNMARKLKKK